MNAAKLGSMLCLGALFATVPGRADNEAGGAIFPTGKRAPAEFYTGTVYGQPLVAKTRSNNFSIGSITFEPGSRTNWHSHPAGQTLLVIEGRGFYQEKDKPVRVLNRGDVIPCDPDIEHWHGAAPESRMVHIAITGYRGPDFIVWRRPVSDEEYNRGNQ
jgi:quercetin dioxygenase-like cupin family protein